MTDTLFGDKDPGQQRKRPTHDDLLGASGNRYSGRPRTNKDRLAAIPAIKAIGEGFERRCKEAEGNVLACADLMAEAIAMKFAANQLEIVGRDGRSHQTFESMNAQHCMRWAVEAYEKARRRNHPPGTPSE